MWLRSLRNLAGCFTRCYCQGSVHVGYWKVMSWKWEPLACQHESADSTKTSFVLKEGLSDDGVSMCIILHMKGDSFILSWFKSWHIQLKYVEAVKAGACSVVQVLLEVLRFFPKKRWKEQRGQTKLTPEESGVVDEMVEMGQMVKMAYGYS